MQTPYALTLSEWELDSLNWLADRGYFPEKLADWIGSNPLDTGIYQQKETNPDHKQVTLYEIGIPEHIAWTLTELRDSDPDAYLACLGGQTRNKILSLEMQIV